MRREGPLVQTVSIHLPYDGSMERCLWAVLVAHVLRSRLTVLQVSVRIGGGATRLRCAWMLCVFYGR